jgi:hypothetical protein
MGATSLATLLISLIIQTFASYVYSQTVCFIVDAILLLLPRSASLTHTLSLSLPYLAVFPLLSVLYLKNWQTFAPYH